MLSEDVVGLSDICSGKANMQAYLGTQAGMEANPFIPHWEYLRWQSIQSGEEWPGMPEAVGSAVKAS